MKVGDYIAVPDYSTGAIKWEKIASIKTLEPQHVYDLSIEGTRNFIANDIVAHNTYLATSSGNKVGIGKTNPATQLDVAGGINASTLNISGNVFLATQSGNVGIGTTTPGEVLHVIGNINVSGVYKAGPAGSATAPVYTYYNDTNTGEFSPLPDTLAFTTGGTERARIDSSGNVGINTTNPASTLQVAGTANITSSSTQFLVNSNGDVVINLKG